MADYERTTRLEYAVENETTLKECPSLVKCCGTNKHMRLLVDDATGFQCYRFAHGAVTMSNVFLPRSLIQLAENAAEDTCEYGDDNINDNDNDDIDIDINGCDLKVYGFKPSSLITNIAVIAGILAAFLLPIVGAVVDYTDHRRALGGATATLLIAIQAVQIYTVQNTWFPMAILQAINSFFYQVVALAAYAYLPEIKQAVGEATMIVYSSRSYSWMFACQVVYLLLITEVGSALENDDVKTAHVGQAVDVVVSGFFYALAFYFFTQRPARRQLPEGNSLSFAGFKQVFHTSRGIFQYYPTTLGFFFLAILFAEAGANSFTVVSVTFLVEYGFNTVETGIVMLTFLIFSIIGSFFASFMMTKLGSPIKSMMLQLAAFMVVNLFMFPIIPKVKILVYVAGALWGLMLGWFYPTEQQLYASLMPQGQETELAGFYLYCTQVMGWLPPLIFTVLNERNIELYWGGIHLNIYLFIALVFYFFLPSWDECIEITAGENQMVKGRDTAVECVEMLQNQKVVVNANVL